MHQIFLCVRLAFKNASEQLLGTATITITMITKKKVETGKSVLTHAGVCGLSTSDHLCILYALPRHTIVCAHFNSLLFFVYPFRYYCSIQLFSICCCRIIAVDRYIVGLEEWIYLALLWRMKKGARNDDKREQAKVEKRHSENFIQIE